MKSVLIADDEKNIRDGLKCIIDWGELGFEIAGEVTNGQDTLEFILEKNPTLVLLDIRMPRLYGTEIIKKAREAGYQGKFIILSGYSDFVYAQTAIKYGVDEYLTKPLDEDELYAAVVKIKASVEQERNRDVSNQVFRRKARSVILHDLVTGVGQGGETDALTYDEIKELNLSASIYQVVIYEHFEENSEGKQYDFAELMDLTDEGNKYFEHFEEDGNEIVLLKGETALSRFRRFLEHYEIEPPQKGSPLDSLFLAYGRCVDTIDEIYLSFEEACELCKRRFFCIQGQHTLGYEELASVTSIRDKISRDKLNEFGRQLTDYCICFNRNRVAEVLNQLEKYLANVDCSTSEIRYFLGDLFLQIKGDVTHKIPDRTSAFDHTAVALKKIGRSRFLYEIIQYISEQIMKVMNELNGADRDSVLDDVMYYIDHNYYENLKLETIAPLFGYSSTYLGRIFTRNAGEPFNSYLDRKRIEESQKLLKEQKLRVYEISKAVGYSNVDYFHKKFKKYTGESPAEYRKRISEAEVCDK